MVSFEERLLSLSRRSVSPPDSDEFLRRLHTRIGHREGVKQSVIAATSVVAVAVIITFGLFQNLLKQSDYDYVAGGDVGFLSDMYGYEVYDDSLYVDETFFWEAMDYLVRDRDLTGSTWQVLEEFEQLGIFSTSETIEKEKSS